MQKQAYHLKKPIPTVWHGGGNITDTAFFNWDWDSSHDGGNHLKLNYFGLKPVCVCVLHCRLPFSTIATQSTNSSKQKKSFRKRWSTKDNDLFYYYLCLFHIKDGKAPNMIYLGFVIYILTGGCIFMYPLYVNPYLVCGTWTYLAPFFFYCLSHIMWFCSLGCEDEDVVIKQTSVV